ncbi:hypothetical protein BJ138DRAFT_1104482 [Hygrophoropsis aurantiaca]|uniref:Uncharacterized protein n=1 Tax=Hygrophoropsis aurantiaca TaxID=72124 RepID=A0ACB8A1F5_9AGAM|nr:hypothetical protein BJ138DRAFT_1104482 [Hygrophoropsis aurantiaca]
MADLALFFYELQIQQIMNYITGTVLNPFKQTLRQLIVHHLQLGEAHLLRTIKIDLVWARYFGSFYVIGNAALYICINWNFSGLWNPNSYVIMYLATSWAQNIFILTMQAILVIRVYALFNQSKKVLTFLATFYVLQAIAIFVLTGLVVNKQVFDGYLTSIEPAFGSVTQAFNVNSSAFPQTMDVDSIIVPMVFDGILLFFALWAFVKHALEAKTLEGGWSINVLVRTLVADQLLYFICNLAWLLLLLASTYGSEVNVAGELLNNMYYVFNALVVVAGPRMVISLRTTENKTRGEGGTLEGEVSVTKTKIANENTKTNDIER